MGYTKEADVRVDVEVDIEFEDVIGYIQHEGLTGYEANELVKEVQKARSTATLPTQYHTIMEELAAEELQEIINIHGVEAVLAQLKTVQF